MIPDDQRPSLIGRRLGVYEIVSSLGAGGMGEVYRARDTTLHRDVAIKVLPAAFASDAERMGRFQREAQLLASLNHPHIAAIYGLEESGSHRAIIMELVDGDTLRGPRPVAEALRLAKQIADAVEYAHDKGIIHRDLKPANIKVTPEGSVKVLDFGLAKALDPAADGGPPRYDSMSPTLSFGVTHTGVILGTAAYMAPEQATGKAADRRADVWAFGVVLYEVLTGERMFGGDTVAETLASVMKDQPTREKLPADTPGAIRKLVARCLDRDVRRRLQSIGEARIVIEDAIAGAVQDDGGPQPSRPISRAPWAVSAVLLVALVAVGALAWAWLPRPFPPTVGVAHFTILPPEGVTLNAQFANASQQAVSPDGCHLAFVGDDSDGSRGLWVRPLRALAAQKLDRTNGPNYPFWSPDSQFIAFFQDGTLRRVPVSGGSPLTICDAPNANGGTWSRDGLIVFAPSQGGPLHRVLATGGVSAPVTELQEGETRHSWPWFFPDGQQFLYFSRLTTGPGIKRDPLWSPDSLRIIYRSEGGETAIRETVAGSGVETTIQADRKDYIPSDWSRDGKTLLFTDGGDVFVLPLDGDQKPRAVLQTPFTEDQLRLSPDGRWVTYMSDESGRPEVYVAAFPTFRDRRQISTRGGMMPLWRRDGRELFYVTPDRTFMAVGVKEGTTLETGSP